MTLSLAPALDSIIGSPCTLWSAAPPLPFSMKVVVLDLPGTGGCVYSGQETFYGGGTGRVRFQRTRRDH